MLPNLIRCVECYFIIKVDLKSLDYVVKRGLTKLFKSVNTERNECHSTTIF